MGQEKAARQSQMKLSLSHTNKSRMHPTTRASAAVEAEPSKKDAGTRLHRNEKIFEDPADVEQLEGRVLSEDDRERESSLAVAPYTGWKRYCGLMFSPSGGNQRRIFLAV